MITEFQVALMATHLSKWSLMTTWKNHTQFTPSLIGCLVCQLMTNLLFLLHAPLPEVYHFSFKFVYVVNSGEWSFASRQGYVTQCRSL